MELKDIEEIKEIYRSCFKVDIEIRTEERIYEQVISGVVPLVLVLINVGCISGDNIPCSLYISV